jgi:hypothetical protein
MNVQKIEPINLQDLASLVQVVSGATTPAAAAPQGATMLSENLFTKTLNLVPANPHLAEYKALLAGKTPYAGVYTIAKLTGLTNLPDQITASLDVKFPRSAT